MTSKMVTLPITTHVTLPFKAGNWDLYTFDYDTQEGNFSGYLYALDMGHAEQLLSEMKSTAVLAGRMVLAERHEDMQGEMFDTTPQKEMTIAEKFSILTLPYSDTFTAQEVSEVVMAIGDNDDYQWKHPHDFYRFLKKYVDVSRNSHDGALHVSYWIAHHWDYFNPIIRKRIS